MSNNKTAMNWFIEELFKKIDYMQVDPKLIEQAKARERFLLHQAYNAGRKNGEKKSELNFNDFLQTFNTDTP